MEKVIIIGGDHHNTLSVIRCFGSRGICITILIHSDEKRIKKNKCSRSRFAKENCFVVNENEESILDWLLSHVDLNKRYVFPCSDLAAYTLDKNKDVLKGLYYIPGFQDGSTSLLFLMNKWKQYILSKEIGVQTPMTWNYAFGDCLPKDIIYPCILKPVVSATGLKSDIKKVNSDAELISSIEVLKEKGYTEILIQEYIDYSMQYLACGCVLPNSDVQCGTIFEKKRESKNGSTGLGVVTNDSVVTSQNEKIIQFLREHKYWGCYDIEYFRHGNDIILNEINLRHSGAGCLLIDNEIPIPYYWLIDRKQVINPEKRNLNPGTKFISEIDDLYNVRIKKISIFRWVNDCFHVSSHTIYNRSDIRGTFSFYCSFLSMIARRFLKLDK